MSTANLREDTQYYKNMVYKLRMTELQQILTYVGKRTSKKKKSDLQLRVMQLIRNKNTSAMLRTKQVYDAYLISTNQTVDPIDNQTTRNLNTYYSSLTNIKPFNLLPVPPTSLLTPPSMAVHPDVKFRKLAFYDLIDVLLKPSSVVGVGLTSIPYARLPIKKEQTFQFYLSPQHTKHLEKNRNTAQIQLRLCLSISNVEQDDAFPNGLNIKVNNKFIVLPVLVPSNKPNVQPKRIPEPLNITSKCSYSVSIPNKVLIQWEEDYGSPSYAMSIALVNKLDSNDLITRLKNKGNRPAEFTMGYIKEKYNSENDSEIKTLELTSSLLCPLGKMRMTLPCKAITCNHLQCFDGATFIKMNELNPKWNCPVCHKACHYEFLNIDGYFYDIIQKCPPSNEIHLGPDGNWNCSETSSTSSNKTESSHKLAKTATVTSSTSSTSNHNNGMSPINLSMSARRPSQDIPSNNSPDCITLDSESESEYEDTTLEDEKVDAAKPPKKRFRPDDAGSDPSSFCVDLTEDTDEDTDDNMSGISHVSVLSNIDDDPKTPPQDLHSWMGLYDPPLPPLPPDTLSSSVPSTSTSTTHKIAAGPPPNDIALSGESSNFYNSFSTYYNKLIPVSSLTQSTSSAFSSVVSSSNTIVSETTLTTINTIEISSTVGASIENGSVNVTNDDDDSEVIILDDDSPPLLSPNPPHLSPELNYMDAYFKSVKRSIMEPIKVPSTSGESSTGKGESSDTITNQISSGNNSSDEPRTIIVWKEDKRNGEGVENDKRKKEKGGYNKKPEKDEDDGDDEEEDSDEGEQPKRVLRLRKQTVNNNRNRRRLIVSDESSAEDEEGDSEEGDSEDGDSEDGSKSGSSSANEAGWDDPSDKSNSSNSDVSSESSATSDEDYTPS